MKKLAPKSEEKTIQEWFNMFPEPYKTQVFMYANKHNNPEERLSRKAHNAFHALDRGFTWANTQEGHMYWSNLYGKLANGKILLEEKALYEIF